MNFMKVAYKYNKTCRCMGVMAPFREAGTISVCGGEDN